MRKSILLKQIDEVIERNNQLFAKCRGLQEKLSEKDLLIEENSRIVEVLKSDNDKLNNLLNEKIKEFDDLKEKFEEFIAEKPKCSGNDISSDNPVSVPNIDSEKVTDENGAEESIAESTVARPNVETFTDPLKNLNIFTSSTAVINEDTLNLCSEAIGRIVLKCAELCNSFAACGRPNSKDLINLALGRTEVFKSEVLTLATENIDSERLKAEVNSREMSVKEYFDLLLRQ